MRTEQNKAGLADSADHGWTLESSPLNPLLPPVLALSAKAISYQFLQRTEPAMTMSRLTLLLSVIFCGALTFGCAPTVVYSHRLKTLRTDSPPNQEVFLSIAWPYASDDSSPDLRATRFECWIGGKDEAFRASGVSNVVAWFQYQGGPEFEATTEFEVPEKNYKRCRAYLTPSAVLVSTGKSTGNDKAMPLGRYTWRVEYLYEGKKCVSVIEAEYFRSSRNGSRPLIFMGWKD